MSGKLSQFYILKINIMLIYLGIFLRDSSFCHQQGLDFDDMSSFFPCEIDAAIQYINLGCGAQAQKMLFYSAFFHFVL